jgi:cell division septal protein FtsQ
MALESEYFPEQTCRLSSLSPEARRAYKKILWVLFGFYTAAIVMMGVVVVESTNFQKAADIVMTGTWPR